MEKIRTDCEQTINLEKCPNMLRAVASAIILANKKQGLNPVYYCTFGGKKTAVVE